MKIPTLLTKDTYKIKRGLDGLGLYATQDIKKDDWIIEYIGKELYGAEASNRMTQYLFEVDKKITLDGSPRYNTARYINYSCNPNAEAHKISKRIFIRALKNIPANTEITYDYGIEFFNAFIKPKGCNCKSKKCKAPRIN